VEKPRVEVQVLIELYCKEPSNFSSQFSGILAIHRKTVMNVEFINPIH
jgi:hypothetical protein